MKSIEGLTIEELRAMHRALTFSIANVKFRGDDWNDYHEIWAELMVDIGQQISDQEFEQERKDNLPIEP